MDYSVFAKAACTPKSAPALRYRPPSAQNTPKIIAFTSDDTPKKTVIGAATPTKAKNKTFDKKPKHYSDAEIQELLKGYLEIPSDKFDILQRQDHIRYIGKDGKFRRGGFIKAIYKNKKGEKEILLETRIGGKLGDKDYFLFSANFNDIKLIYKKIKDRLPNELTIAKINTDKKIQTVNSDIDSLKQHILKLEQSISKLEQRINKIERKS
jgi:hypothetical protein